MKGLDLSLHDETIKGTGTLGGGIEYDEDFPPDNIVDIILYESKSQSLVGAPADAIAAVLMTSQEHNKEHKDSYKYSLYSAGMITLTLLSNSSGKLSEHINLDFL